MAKKSPLDETRRILAAQAALAEATGSSGGNRGSGGNGGGSGGKIAANIMHFARVLRAAGLPVGPGKVLDALRAVEAVGLGNREDFYWTLHAALVNRRDQREIFDQAFHIFWRNPQLLERMSALVLPSFVDPAKEAEAEEINRRLAQALKGDQPDAGDDGADGDDEPEVTVDAVMTWSAPEVLQEMDYEKMSTD